ncbi:TPA: phage portal protein [Citrobacter freundii]|jgi:HK97 family phage portal protein|uniref:phage portal protein n=1 Tax=Citrobacter amalonaticus TaxID=35703 RepID=UPI001A2433F0|nr:phage portal protein [Citrobacter amalonaticus]MBU5647964.1 phage portal protein [Pluralibacter sp. S54_ASV_43]HAT2287616.1 phage portal protein [Citrobacter freundii]HCB1654477.1 phage portal protein [Citrobacter farmeri]HAT2351748.1 phage portal protein [Citrobacter freundii]
MFFPGLFQKSGTPVSTPAQLAEMAGYSYDTYTGRRVSSRRAMHLTAVFGCIRVLAESMGMLPCNLLKVTGDRKEKAVNERLHKLLSVQPNEYMTPQEFWELIIVCLCLRGNFYAYKVYALGEVVELLPLDPGSVVPKLNSKWEPVYQVTFPDGTSDILTQEEIWHVRTLTFDGLVGLNPIAYARQAVALGLATEEHGARLFSNGAVTSGVLQTEQQLTDQAFERLKNDFEEKHQGLGNAHKPMILEMGLQWKQMALSAEDAQFLETRKFQLEEICRLYRVPMHMVQNTDRATFNNIENLGIGFINYSLVPYMTRIEQRINVGLVKKSKRGQFFAKFNAGALLRGDMKSRFDAYATGINWGMFSPNDCLELEDRNPRPGGDIYLTPMNMTTKPSDGSKQKSTEDPPHDDEPV